VGLTVLAHHVVYEVIFKHVYDKLLTPMPYIKL